ncbi:MAG: hypothetical protein FJ116_10260 [Deltaproteobacteria bacterium]|nr:hypothetical protein [Deltaproteobacteria bacterium]MBM4317847.1 hypothetical protein [Deltaproteobacteria bacterium]
MKSLLSLFRFFLFVLLSLNTMSIITLSFSLVARAEHDVTLEISKSSRSVSPKLELEQTTKPVGYAYDVTLQEGYDALFLKQCIEKFFPKSGWKVKKLGPAANQVQLNCPQKMTTDQAKLLHKVTGFISVNELKLKDFIKSLETKSKYGDLRDHTVPLGLVPLPQY